MRFSLYKKSFSSKKYYSMLLSGTMSSIVVSILLLSDYIIAGLRIGKVAVAGINLVTPIYSFGAFLGQMFSLGVPVIFSNEMGKFDKKRANDIYAVANFMTLFAGALMFLVISLFGDNYIKIFNPSKEMFFFAQHYLYWIKYVILIMPFAALLNDMVYADGGEHLVGVANIIYATTNIILSILLSKNYETYGIGLASFIAYIILILVNFIHYLDKSNNLRLNFKCKIKDVLLIIEHSMIDASSFLFLSLFIFIMNKFFETKFGVGSIQLVTIVTIIKDSCFLFDGIGQAITPLVGMYLGENTFEGVKKIFKLAKHSSMIEGLFITTIIFLLSPQICLILDINAEPYFSLGVYGLRVMSLSFAFISFTYLITSYYLLINKISLGILITGCRELIFAAPLAIIFGTVFGEKAVFWAVMLSPILAYVFNVLYIMVKRGKEYYPLLLDFNDNKNTLFYEFVVNPKNIAVAIEKVDTLLKNNNCSLIAINRSELIFEELYMMVYNKNKDKTVYAEATIDINKNKIRMILKDDGELFNITDEDVNVDSLRTYVVSNVLQEAVERKQYLTTMSYNRNVFEIDK